MNDQPSAFEQSLVEAMSEFAHSAEPPGFDGADIVAGERRRTRMRRSVAGACAAVVLGAGAWIVSSAPGPWHSDHAVVGGPTGTPSAGATGGAASPSPGPHGTGGPTSPGSAANWPTGPTSSPFTGTVPPVPELVAVGFGRHPAQGYESVTFEFSGALPGYTARYVPQVVRDGSGQPVALPGSAHLQLTFNSARAHAASGASTLVNPATNPVGLGYPQVRSYVVNGDFEGTVSVALGLTAKDGYHIGVLTESPTDHVIYVNIAIPAGK